MSAFEDLMSMKTRAFLVKDIDPTILQRLLGTRSLATELSEQELNEYYLNKAPIPTDSSGLLNLMSHGGGLEKSFNNPLYKEKLQNIDIEVMREWVQELCQNGEIVKIRNTGSVELDEKWFTPYMAEIHGTLGCLATKGGKDVKDLRELLTEGMEYEIAVEYDGLKPTKWKTMKISDPHVAMRVKIIEMLGSEGPKMADEIETRLPFSKELVDRILHELESRNVISVGFYKQTDEAEYILKIDEHRLTGGEEEVVEYRWVQNMVFDKSFSKYEDGFSAFDSHVIFQKQQELLTVWTSSDSKTGKICRWIQTLLWAVCFTTE